MTLKDHHADYIGSIDPASRTASRVECGDCSAVISDDAPAFVYYDLAAGAIFLLCKKCHETPEGTSSWA